MTKEKVVHKSKRKNVIKITAAAIKDADLLLDVLVNLPLAEALEPLNLPEGICDALLRRDGLLYPLLQLAIACEQADEAAFAQAAGHLHLSNHQVNWAHLQALAWVEEMAQAL